MELKHLETFVVVAETLNFSHAAEHLNYAQSTITTHIQALENNLSVVLFNRMHRKVTLTIHGERLLAYARRMIDLEAEMTSAVSSGAEPEGTLTIGSSETVLSYRLPPLLRAFQDKYPNVRLRLRPYHYEDLLDAARRGDVDAAFIFEKPIRSKSIETLLLVEEPLMLVSAPDHRLAQYDRIEPLDLESVSLLFTDVSCGYRPLFEKTLISAGMRPKTNLEFHSLEAIKQCVIAGLGVTVMPLVAVQKELASGKLVQLPWFVSDFAVWTQLVWAKSSYISPSLERFAGLAEELMIPPALSGSLPAVSA